MEQAKRYGLVGKNISYSFSREYFKEKFKKLQLTNHSYENFDLSDISEFENLVGSNHLSGLNVTIPYKEAVIPYLDDLSETAQQIGAVNTIAFTTDGLIGHNTDAYGFEHSLRTLLQPHHTTALILGTGGASKAVAFVLEKLNIEATFVSRTEREGMLTYQALKSGLLQTYTLIVNCTPLGTYPNINAKPNLPYGLLSEKHLLYDLIYNPEKTAFLQEGEKHGAAIKNGLEMLQLQAEKAWEIWHS